MVAMAWEPRAALCCRLRFATSRAADRPLIVAGRTPLSQIVITEEALHWKDVAHRVAEEVVRPVAKHYDEVQEYPEEVRQAYIENGAIQCGFCTPGMLISSYALLRDNQNPSPHEVKLAIEGNICRCTGYTKIIEAVLDAAERIAVE